MVKKAATNKPTQVQKVAAFMLAHPNASVEEMMKEVGIKSKAAAYTLRNQAKKRLAEGQGGWTVVGAVSSDKPKETPATPSKLAPIQDLQTRYNEAVKLVDIQFERINEMQREMADDAETIIDLRKSLREAVIIGEYLEERVTELTVRSSLFKAALKSMASGEAEEVVED
jgi:hypothetical protein